LVGGREYNIRWSGAGRSSHSGSTTLEKRDDSSAKEQDVQADADARAGARAGDGGGVGLASSARMRCANYLVERSKEKLVVGWRALRATLSVEGWIGLLERFLEFYTHQSA
jgi:hypothetical protein